MADLNKVFLMGRLTFDPELRRTPSGTAVTELRLATNRSWTGQGRRAQGRDAVHRRDRLGPPGRDLLPVPQEGEPVHVEGSLKMDTWDDKTTGEKRSKIKVAGRPRPVPRPPRRRRAAAAAAADDEYAAPPATPPRRAGPPSPGGRATARPGAATARPGAGAADAAGPAAEPDAERRRYPVLIRSDRDRSARPEPAERRTSTFATPVPRSECCIMAKMTDKKPAKAKPKAKAKATTKAKAAAAPRQGRRPSSRPGRPPAGRRAPAEPSDAGQERPHAGPADPRRPPLRPARRPRQGPPRLRPQLPAAPGPGHVRDPAQPADRREAPPAAPRARRGPPRRPR